MNPDGYGFGEDGEAVPVAQFDFDAGDREEGRALLAAAFQNEFAREAFHDAVGAAARDIAGKLLGLIVETGAPQAKGRSRRVPLALRVATNALRVAWVMRHHSVAGMTWGQVQDALGLCAATAHKQSRHLDSELDRINGLTLESKPTTRRTNRKPGL